MNEIKIDKFDEFIEECVINKKAILTTSLSYNKDEKLFKKENLNKAKAFLKEVKTLFDTKNAEARNKNKENRNTKEKTWGIGDIFSGYVFQVLTKKYSESQEVIIKILLHCNWLMYLCSERQHKQDTGNNQYYKDNIESYSETETYWSIGQAFSGTSLDAMLFIVELFLKLDEFKKDKKEEIKIEIIRLCNDSNWKDGLKWNEKDNKPISSNSISNVLLFLCKPDYYLPIPAQNKKVLISKNLKAPQNEEQTEKKTAPEMVSEIDRSLFKIRQEIRGVYQKLAEAAQTNSEEEKAKEFLKIADMPNPFWQPTIRPFWDNSTSDLTSKDLSDEVLLEYKKAMVLYGPPGTSKSYQARRMAENMIAKALKNTNTNIKECLEAIDTIFKQHIHILQLHPNYTYEDFIIGKSITVDKMGGTKISVKPGKLLKIIAGIESNDELPHIVILDEINRVDISRVFGELFTAMEPSYREKGVELSADISQIEEEDKKSLNIDEETNRIYLKVPQNMYFIGTMNMIDFSLEQVDFALRRRFLWRLSTYDEKRLEDILSEKVEKKIDGIKDSNTKEKYRNRPDNYVDCCTKLNNNIEWESNLGKDYLIGHAFFAEIVDIFEQVNYDWDVAKKILWHISILPTIEAYCGTMDANSKESFIGKCNDAFFPKPKQDKNTKKEQPESTEE